MQSACIRNLCRLIPNCKRSSIPRCSNKKGDPPFVSQWIRKRELGSAHHHLPRRTSREGTKVIAGLIFVPYRLALTECEEAQPILLAKFNSQIQIICAIANRFEWVFPTIFVEISKDGLIVWEHKLFVVTRSKYAVGVHPAQVSLDPVHSFKRVDFIGLSIADPRFQILTTRLCTDTNNGDAFPREGGNRLSKNRYERKFCRLHSDNLLPLRE